VGLVCSPLNPKVRAEDKTDDLPWEVEQSLEANEDNPWPVVDDNGDVVGVLWPENTYEHESEDPPDPSHPYPWLVREVMEPTRPYEILSSATTILDAVLAGSRDAARLRRDKMLPELAMQARSDLPSAAQCANPVSG
jgi:hypothetical protein